MPSKEKVIDTADHALLLSLAITFMVVAWMAILTALFAKLGWNGPASLFKHP